MRQVAQAAPDHVDAPIVDQVIVREIQHNIFLKPLKAPGIFLKPVEGALG